MTSTPQKQKCLDFDLARAIQRDIEALPGAWSCSLVSLAERNPNAYRVEIHAGGTSGRAIAEFQTIAEAHGVWLTVTAHEDLNQLRIVFDRPGQWYAEGNHHRLAAKP